MANKADRQYLVEHRLSDVLALIQVLALDRHAHRGEGGLKAELQAIPRSAKSWEEVAIDHPEFFRVVPGGGHGISLLARHVSEPSADGARPLLNGDQVDSLLKAAIEIHDRQVRRSERWHAMLPLWLALLSGGFTLLGVWLGKHS